MFWGNSIYPGVSTWTCLILSRRTKKKPTPEEVQNPGEIYFCKIVRRKKLPKEGAKGNPGTRAAESTLKVAEKKIRWLGVLVEVKMQIMAPFKLLLVHVSGAARTPCSVCGAHLATISARGVILSVVCTADVALLCHPVSGISTHFLLHPSRGSLNFSPFPSSCKDWSLSFNFFESWDPTTDCLKSHSIENYSNSAETEPLKVSKASLFTPRDRKGAAP